MEAEEEKIKFDDLKFILVEFCIPYSLRLRDSEMNRYNEKSHQVFLEGIPAIINFERVVDYRYKEEKGIKLNIERHVKGDRHGINAYSKVQVWFDYQTFSQDFFDRSFLMFVGNLDFLAKRAIQYVNKFIREYRDLTRDYWIRPITTSEISGCLFQAHTKDGRSTWAKQTLEEIDVKLLERPQTLTDEELDALKQKLQCEDYQFRSEIFLDALDFQSMEKHNVALLLAVTRFENFVYRELKELLSNTKLNKIKKKESCGCLAGITEVCTRGFKENFDFDFESTPEWIDLRDKALRPRNKIVHGEEEEEISKKVCDEALAAVKTAEIYLHNHLFSKQPGYVFPKVRH